MNHLVLAIGLLMGALTLPGCSSSNSLLSRSDPPAQTKETNIRGDMSPIGITQYVRQ